MYLKLCVGLLSLGLVIVGALYFLKSPYSPFYSSVLGSSSVSQPTTTTASSGYSYLKVKTSLGNFYANVYKVDLSKVNIRTVSAAKETCKNNCPTKTLKQYVEENNAIAGINGSYFCPPDYASCKGKKNSFDFAFYNSNKRTWMNKSALKWFKTGIATFSGSKARFYMNSAQATTDGITAAISNYPALIENGKIVVEKGDIQPYQRNKGTKGFIGTDGKYLYFVLASNVTIVEEAYVARALGLTGALNIDGGGSSALFVNGSYKVGPGRLLPNAVVVVKK